MKIRLRRMNVDDVPFTVRLRNGADTQHWFFATEELTVEDSRKWFLSRDPETDWDFIAECDGEPVGYIAIYDIDWKEKRAEFGGWVLAPELRSTGAAGQMGRQMIRIAKESGLRLLYSDGRLDNVRSMRACEKVGFRAELIREEKRFRVTLNPQTWNE